MVGLLSTIGVRWRSLALRRWSSSISWIAWDMHALIFGTIIGIVRITVTITLLTSLDAKVIDDHLPWQGRRRFLMNRCHDNALSALTSMARRRVKFFTSMAMFINVVVGAHHHHHALRDALGEE